MNDKDDIIIARLCNLVECCTSHSGKFILTKFWQKNKEEI